MLLRISRGLMLFSRTPRAAGVPRSLGRPDPRISRGLISAPTASSFPMKRPTQERFLGDRRKLIAMENHRSNDAPEFAADCPILGTFREPGFALLLAGASPGLRS